MTAIWKPSEGEYDVSDDGRVRRRGTTRELALCINAQGYLRVDLHINGRHTRFSVHRLVAQAHLPNPHNLPVVDHVDHDVTNNRVDNLRWCTQSQNRCNARKAAGVHSSDYKGVRYRADRPNPWRAGTRLCIDGVTRSISLGSYATERDAARAYNAYAIAHYGEFAVLNVIAD